MHELLTGSPPFESPDRETCVSSILERAIDEAFVAGMSEDVKRFIRIAGAKISSNRPSARELIAHPWIRKNMQLAAQHRREVAASEAVGRAAAGAAGPAAAAVRSPPSPPS